MNKEEEIKEWIVEGEFNPNSFPRYEKEIEEKWEIEYKPEWNIQTFEEHYIVKSAITHRLHLGIELKCKIVKSGTKAIFTIKRLLVEFLRINPECKKHHCYIPEEELDERVKKGRCAYSESTYC